MEWKTLRRHLKACDTQRLGCVSVAALRHAMEKVNVDITSEDFFTLVAQFDQNLSGTIAYDLFLQAVLA